MNITEILQRQADQHSSEIAIIDRVGRRTRHTTFGDFDQAVGKMSAMLRESNLTPGDTALLLHPMSAELYIALAAILRNGMTAMFVDPYSGTRAIERCCDLMPPQAMITSSKAHLLRLTSSALRRIPNKWSIGNRVPFTQRIEDFVDWTDDRRVHCCNEQSSALASFTSGTTGQPKAAIRTHGFLLAQHRAVEESLSLTPGEVELVTMPVFVLANLASRVTSVIADADLRRPGEIDPEPVLRQIEENQVDRLTASPAFIERIVNDCQDNGLVLESIRKVFTGGGPVTPRLLDQLRSVAPNSEITAVYGSTEAEPISTIAANEIDRQDIIAMNSGRGLLAGKPVRRIEARIIGDHWGNPIGTLTVEQFATRCQPPNQPGEIVVAGDHVLQGYLNGHQDEENKFRVDQTVWHRTGDAGYFDNQGRLWLLGRCSARLDDGHGALYPLGVEAAALGDPNIGQAAMVSHRGRRILAVALRDPQGQVDGLQTDRLLKSLSFANVDSICVLRRIPLDRRHQSKIDYPSLHHLLEQ